MYNIYSIYHTLALQFSTFLKDPVSYVLRDCSPFLRPFNKFLQMNKCVSIYIDIHIERKIHSHSYKNSSLTTHLTVQNLIELPNIPISPQIKSQTKTHDVICQKYPFLKNIIVRIIKLQMTIIILIISYRLTN